MLKASLLPRTARRTVKIRALKLKTPVHCRDYVTFPTYEYCISMNVNVKKMLSATSENISVLLIPMFWLLHWEVKPCRCSVVQYLCNT